MGKTIVFPRVAASQCATKTTTTFSSSSRSLANSQAQFGKKFATSAIPAARGDDAAEGGGQVEAVQLYPELGFANDSMQTVRVSDGRRRRRYDTKGQSGRRRSSSSAGLTRTMCPTCGLVNDVTRGRRNTV